MFLDIIAACCSLSVGFLFGFGSTGFAASFSGSSLNLIPALKLNKQKNGIDTVFLFVQFQTKKRYRYRQSYRYETIQQLSSRPSLNISFSSALSNIYNGLSAFSVHRSPTLIQALTWPVKMCLPGRRALRSGMLHILL